MKYEWENEIEEILAHGDIDCEMPEGMVVLAVAVANVETGEAALIQINGDGEPAGSVISANYRMDILGDAQGHYDSARSAMIGSRPVNQSAIH